MTRACISVSLCLAALASVVGPAAAASLPVATPKVVTNTIGGKNQNPSIDRTGSVIVFTSNVNDSGPTTFDATGAGNAFGLLPPCINCANADGNGELFIWHLKAKNGEPANSFRQLTFTPTGGFNANRMPDMNQKATAVVWDSDQDQTPGTPGNADGNREIFVQDLKTHATVQVTNTIGGSGSANENTNIADDGQTLVFDSNRDFAVAGNCTLADGSSPCANADGNSELMLYSRATDSLTQLTVTSGGAGSANLRPRISNDAKFVAFQSTRNFSGPLAAGASCTQLGGGTCDNTDGNGEIMRYDIVKKAFTQVTSTTTGGSCSGANPNERVEISKGGKFVSFQTKCEQQLNPTGCGSCDGSDTDEAFLADFKKQKLLQVTISDGGFNRVPRVSGNGAYVIFETNHTYRGQNPTASKTLFIVKRDTKAGTGTTTGKGQVVDDLSSGLTQNPKTKATTINFSGGFNSSIEIFGASTSGKRYAFDNSKLVGNQEIWFLDRTK